MHFHTTSSFPQNSLRQRVCVHKLPHHPFQVRDALQTSFASVAQSMSSAAGSEGKLSKAQFHEAFSGLELNLGGGSTMRLTQSQIDDLFSQADIDGDGVISRTEFLTAFKGSSSDKGMDMTGMEQAGARSRKLALGKQAGEENESNQNRLDDLQTGLKEIGGDVKSLQELAKRREAEAKEKKKAEENMKKFNVLADAAKKKADSAKAKIAASKSVLEGGTADAKEIKKAQQAMVEANKDLLEAKKQLESAQVLLLTASLGFWIQNPGIRFERFGNIRVRQVPRVLGLVRSQN